MFSNNELTLQFANACCYISVVIHILLVIYIFNNHIEQSMKFIARWSILSISLLASSCIILAWRLETKNLFIEMYIINVLFGILWALGTVSIYILFIKRLHLTFYGTKWNISKNMYRLLYFGCALFLMVFIMADISYYMKLGGTISENNYTDMAVLNIILQQIIDFVLSITLMTIFIQRLRRLNIEIGVNDNNFDKNKSIQSDSTLNKSQMMIVSSMSKVTILSCVAIISTQVFLIYEGIIYWLGTPVMLNNIRYLLVALDCSINSICVVLSFDFANRFYNRLCCCCDYGCQRLCTYQAKKQLDDHRVTLLQLEKPYEL